MELQETWCNDELDFNLKGMPFFLGIFYYFLYKFCLNLLDGGIQKDRASAKQSLLSWPCLLPSDCAMPDLWQNFESNVWHTHIATHGQALTDFTWLCPATNRNHTLTRQEIHKHWAPVAPWTPDLSTLDVCSNHTESCALLTELRDRLNELQLK